MIQVKSTVSIWTVLSRQTSTLFVATDINEVHKPLSVEVHLILILERYLNRRSPEACTRI